MIRVSVFQQANGIKCIRRAFPFEFDRLQFKLLFPEMASFSISTLCILSENEFFVYAAEFGWA